MIYSWSTLKAVTIHNIDIYCSLVICIIIYSINNEVYEYKLEIQWLQEKVISIWWKKRMVRNKKKYVLNVHDEMKT